MPLSPNLPPVAAPARFVPAQAIAFGTAGTNAIGVSNATPLPVQTIMPPSTSHPLTGTANVSVVAGPFMPDTGRAIWATLTGEWDGLVRLLRSVDGGATRLPLTVGGANWAEFSGNANEPVGIESEAGASYYLDIVLNSGTLGYRVSQ